MFNKNIWCAKIFDDILTELAERKSVGDSDIVLSKTVISDISGSNRQTVDGCIGYIVAKANDPSVHAAYEQSNPGQRFPLSLHGRPAMKVYNLEGKTSGIYFDPEASLNSMIVKMLDDARRASLFNGLPALPFVEELRDAYYSVSGNIIKSLFRKVKAES